jgi:UDP-N-acetylmuramoyl-L-alanyl-D-glutamate--2,6-diaminopimelate ligase
MEVSSHALDQQRTVAIDFDVAVFTNLSRDHLDYHGSMQAYAEAKYLLFKNLRPSATAVINADDNYAELMAKTAAQTQLFSFKNLVEANVHARIKEIGSAGMTVEVQDISLQTRLIGRFNAQNLVAAILAAKALGINESNMEGASPGLVPADGRMQFVSIEDSEFLPLVVVDYAHTPDAMENTLAAVHEILEKGKSLSVIFGCGGDRDRGKRPEMAAIAERYAHKIYVTEDNPRTEDSDQIFSDILKGFSSDASYSVIRSRKEAIQKAITQASEHEILLILGKGHETYQEIGTTRHHFDDREEARSALRAHLAALKKAGGAH